MCIRDRFIFECVCPDFIIQQFRIFIPPSQQIIVIDCNDSDIGLATGSVFVDFVDDVTHFSVEDTDWMEDFNWMLHLTPHYPATFLVMTILKIVITVLTVFFWRIIDSDSTRADPCFGVMGSCNSCIVSLVSFENISFPFTTVNDLPHLCLLAW